MFIQRQKLAKPKSLGHGVAHVSFAIQNHIDENAIDAVALCKCTLTALALNCETHQPNNFVFLKDDGAATQIARA